jgi:hypothetical protein
MPSPTPAQLSYFLSISHFGERSRHRRVYIAYGKGEGRGSFDGTRTSKTMNALGPFSPGNLSISRKTESTRKDNERNYRVNRRIHFGKKAVDGARRPKEDFFPLSLFCTKFLLSDTRGKYLVLLHDDKLTLFLVFFPSTNWTRESFSPPLSSSFSSSSRMSTSAAAFAGLFASSEISRPICIGTAISRGSGGREIDVSSTKFGFLRCCQGR